MTDVHGRPGITRAVRAMDFLRRPAEPLPGLDAHKEWHHFLIHDGQHLTLVNLSLSEERQKDGREQTVARLKLLHHDGSVFSGDMAVFPPAEVRARAGSVDVAFGPSAIRFADGRYELSILLPDVDVEVELSVVPETLPLLTNNLALAAGRPLCWLATHSLRAWGSVRCGNTVQTYEGAPAYHDHNWGYFRWGDDFAWEWGTLLHDRNKSPFSLSFVRIMDRARLRVTVASVYLWEGARLLTIFRDRELAFHHSGRVRSRSIVKIPKVMALLQPDTATDVPARVDVRCERPGAVLEGSLSLQAMAQILMPDELGDDTVTTLNQCLMWADFRGSIGGRAFSLEAPGVFEFIRG